jgi:pimeloyl-ACP methyl ester carboxylesterase
MNSVARWILALCLLCAGVLPSVPDVSAKPAPNSTALMTKKLVTIGGNRRLNMICVGRGYPTIVFESGLGSHLLHWQKVIGPIAQLTRACFYDRAGYGFSDPSPRPSTAANAVQDLHELLRHSGERRPVVLVGHSLGGLYGTLYADRYPDDVTGLVLIEPSFAEQDKDESQDEKSADAVAFAKYVSQLRNCAEMARSGQLRSKPHEECFAFASERTASEKAFLAFQMVRPSRYEAMASEAESQHSADGRTDINSREELAAQREFGTMPLVVLTAAQAIDARATADERAAASRLWQSWRAGHEKLAKRSARGKSTIVPATGHFVQLDQPQAVIGAIREIVNEARSMRHR